jgi:hypothetical protein
VEYNKLVEENRKLKAESERRAAPGPRGAVRGARPAEHQKNKAFDFLRDIEKQTPQKDERAMDMVQGWRARAAKCSDSR